MTNSWPDDLSFAAFKRKLPYNQSSIYTAVFAQFCDQIQVQKKDSAIPNLEKIFKATFRLSSKQSFHAMSLRDLSRETGISMGGLYNYIGSKEELAHMIESFMNTKMIEMGVELVGDVSDPSRRMEMVLRVYIFMAEVFQPWYQFVYMETKSMTKRQKEVAKGMEIRDIEMFKGFMEEGQRRGDIDPHLCPKMVASIILCMVQNWYLKRWRFTQDGVNPDTYVDFVISNQP